MIFSFFTFSTQYFPHNIKYENYRLKAFRQGRVSICIVTTFPLRLLTDYIMINIINNGSSNIQTAGQCELLTFIIDFGFAYYIPCQSRLSKNQQSNALPSITFQNGFNSVHANLINERDYL